MDNSPSRFSIVQNAGTWRTMFRLSLPVLAEETMFLSVTWTDWWLTGHYLQGDSAKAAMGVMGYVMWILPTLFAAVAIGATALVARYVGGNQPESATRTANQAFLIGTSMAGLITLLCGVAAVPLISVTQLQGQSLELGLEYFYIITPAIPFIMLSQVGSACLRGAGDMVSGFLVKLGVVLVNIVVSTGLVTGWGWFPTLEWSGIAIGTACGHIAGGISLFLILLVGRAGLAVRWRWLTPDWKVIRGILRIGIPGGFDLVTIVGSQFVFVGIINRMGEAAGAAHGLAVQIEALAWMPGTAFQVAAATLVGQYLGARQFEKASRAAVHCLAAGMAVMVGSGLLLFFLGQHLTYFFTGDWEHPTTQTATQLLRIIAFAMPCLATVMVLSGALRGAGDTRWSMLFSMIGFFAVRIPLALLLAWPYIEVSGFRIPGADLGVEGAWYAMAADLVVRSLLIGARFLHGGWKHIPID